MAMLQIGLKTNLVEEGDVLETSEWLFWLLPLLL